MIEKPCLGPYEIVGKLGAGGMGIVYRAYHTTLHREVALKVLDSKLAEDDASQRRFVREMQVAAGLAHPGLIRVYDGGVLEDELFIAMELVEGHGLDWMVSRHAPVPWTLGLAVGSRVADPLQYLHEQKILHRDIKPSNVLVSKAGEVKLGDFGLARPAGGPQLTMPGELVGTLLFMPPEALLGDPSTELSDLWALGCVLYLLITGQPHVTATNYNELVQGVLAGPIPPPSRLVHDLPAEVSQLILALLARNPDHRIRSAREVKERIDALVLTHAGTTPDLVLSDGFLDRIQAGPPQAPSTSPPGDSTERLPVDELERSPRTQVSKNRRALPEAPGPPGRSDASGTVAPDRPAGSAGPEPADSGAGRAAGQRPPSGPGSRPSRPSSPGVPRVRNVTPPPTAPLCRSPWPVAALCGTLAVAGLLAVMRTGPCQPPPPTTRVRPPSPGSPASSPASPSATSIFMEWKRLVPFLPRLRSTSTVAKKAVDEIRKVSRLDVGLGKEVWIHWLEMGMWLANPGRSRNPPHYRKTLHVQLH
ncbi:MAG: protein kinase, partial [Candidatus Riflebacteria bacterium]|nr:protein kinase [Candidatus Riflebacteria bacterium]